MDTHYTKTMFVHVMTIMVILAITLSVSMVAYAAPSSPFVGHWEAIDVDGSDIRLSIGGPPNGPYQITWTESYISFCGGEAGIVRGTGMLSENEVNLLEADLHLECFATGVALDFHLSFRYHPVTNTLSTRYDSGDVTIWHRPGGGQVQEPPILGLRVNYGHDWVESFYEAGHTVWISVTDGDVNLKATAELFTEPKDFWGGETGFQTSDLVWLDSEGIQMEYPPDIQPYDWVYGWVDNGASAQVQIGDISGMIDLANDSIEGTISAPWSSSEVDVDCHPWGAPMPEEILKYDAVLPDGEDTYSCSWAGEWDIRPGQDVGVGYSGTDGHWVANTFFIPMPSFAAYMPSAIEGYDWPLGNTITLNINDGEYTAQAISEQRPDFPEGETRVLFELWRDGFSMEAGDHILMTDEALDFTKELYVADLGVTEINLGDQTVSGIYEPTYPDFWIWLDGQEPLEVLFDKNTWVATFAEIMPGTGGTVAQDDWDHDGTVWDFYVPNTPYIRAHPVWDNVDAWFWPEEATLQLSIDDPNTENYPDLEMDMPGEVDPNIGSVWFDFAGVYDLKPGDLVTVTDGVTKKILIVSILSIDAVNVDEDSAWGTVEPGTEVRLPSPDNELFVTGDYEGHWFADFTQIGFDLTPGTMVIAEVFEEDGDNSSFEWYIPNTRFTVWPEWNYLEGYEWPDGAVVSISVAGKEVCSTEAVSGFPEWDPSNTFFSLSFPEGCEIGAGDLITLSFEDLNLTHQVQELAITEVNLDFDTVAGTAIFDPEQYILHTWIHEVDGSYIQLSAEYGAWLADFGSLEFDLQPGMGGRVELIDQASNATAAEWWIPNPHFVVFPEWEWFDGNDWPDGALVNITVFNKPECTTQKESWGGFFNGSFGEGCDVVDGDTVTFTDGVTTRSHLVQYLAVTSVDKQANTVSGTADEGAVVHAWAHEYGYEMEIQAEGGTWLADFGLAGLDLMENMGGRSEIRDEFGNATAVDWYIPNPHIVASITED